MTNEQKNEPPEVAPTPEVRYTEEFARERARRNRRLRLFGGIGFTLCGIFVLHDTVVAIRTDTLVLLGRVGGPKYPPFIAGPVGVFTLLIGLWILGSLLVRHNEK